MVANEVRAPSSASENQCSWEISSPRATTKRRVKPCALVNASYFVNKKMLAQLLGVRNLLDPERVTKRVYQTVIGRQLTPPLHHESRLPNMETTGWINTLRHPKSEYGKTMGGKSEKMSGEQLST